MGTKFNSAQEINANETKAIRATRSHIALVLRVHSLNYMNTFLTVNFKWKN